MAKKGINKADHGIVYVGSSIPEPDAEELPIRGELPMVQIPIRVDPDSRTEKLGHKSRIHYNKVYTIEHNVKARSVGMITRSLPDLISQTSLVWSRTANGLGKFGLVPGGTAQLENGDDTSETSQTSTGILPDQSQQVELETSTSN